MDGIPMIDWLELRSAGLYCIPGEFYIDPSTSVPKAVVSHAHADHYPRYCHEVHATPETLAIGNIRYQNTAAKTPIGHAYGEIFFVGPVAVTLLSAGHILGSAQVLLQYNGQTALYSGDIGFDENPTCPPLTLPEMPVDLLICESTFGEKENHQAPLQALESTLEIAGKRNLIIATYVLGKAQRLNRLLTDLRPSIKIFVDATIAPMHKIYESYGISIGQHQLYRRQDAKRHQGQYIWLLPPHKMTGFHRDREFYKVFASGWNKTAQSSWINGQLEISDHASQSELQSYVSALNPKEVRFWHGYPTSLIAHCQSLGIQASEMLPVEKATL